MKTISKIKRSWKLFVPISILFQLIFTLKIVAQISPPKGMWQAVGSDSMYTNRKVNIMNKLSTDSLHVMGTLRVGENSLYLNGSQTGPTGTSPDQITSSFGQIAVGNNNTSNFSNIRVGIGSQTPQNQLHLHRETNTALYTQFTNLSTSNTGTDGLQIGISTTGAAEFRQRENRPTTFYNFTASSQRERLKIYSTVDDDGVTNAASTGMVRIGVNNGEGAINNVSNNNQAGSLAQLVVGGSQTFDLNNHVVAEFRNRFNASASTGINIRGSRLSYSNNSPSSFINFTNFHNTNNQESLLSRIGTGIQYDNNTLGGYLALSTSNSTGVLEQKMYISSEGRVGIATGLFQGVTADEIPARRLDVVDRNADNSYLPQLRLTQTYHRFDINSTSRFTELGTNSTGDFIIQPSRGNGSAILQRNVGINTNTPQNTLDIFANTADASGLRFSRLNNSFMPSDDNYNGVLSVDNQGNVILVEDREGTGGLVDANNGLNNDDDQTIVELGGDLIKNTDIGLNGNNFTIDGNNSNGRVGIGISNNIASKVHIVNRSNDIGFMVESDNFFTQFKAGLISYVDNPNGLENYGGIFQSFGGTNNFGLFSEASGGSLSYGIWGQSTNGIFGNYGGLFIGGEIPFGSNPAIPDGNWSVVGMSAGVADDAPNPIPSTTDFSAAYFGGRVVIDGPLWATAINGSVSDINLKKDIADLTSTLEIVNQLQPKTFYFDTLNSAKISLNKKLQYGFIAQDVEQILPELVSENKKPTMRDKEGNIVQEEFIYKTLNYDGFIAILTKAVQEQQARIEQLEALLNPSGARMGNTNQTTETDQESITVKEIKLSNHAIVLSQNSPNPFKEKTTISYTIPEKSGYAQIIFNDNLGRIIKTVDIETTGKGELIVYAEDLSNGTYTYSLVIDGKTIDTKKMLKQD